jgi:hypothetical protein
MHVRRLPLSVLASMLALGAAFVACDRSDLIEVLGQTRAWEGQGAMDAPGVVSIPFTVFSDDVGDKAATERHVLFKTRDAYLGFFGHAPPAGVDLGKDWVIFYAAGTKPTGGYAASIAALYTREVGRDKLLQAVSRLESPGPGCGVTASLTSPHVLVKFAAQTAVFNVDFARADTTVDCGGGPADPCAAVRCAKGTHCQARPVVCVRAPCPPIAMCVKDATEVRCGGIAGRPCPGRGRCDDDPNDSCDPAHGGADCGGICTCIQNVACTVDTVFDSSPAVCACVKR